jgi:hypothetical protein
MNFHIFSAYYSEISLLKFSPSYLGIISESDNIFQICFRGQFGVFWQFQIFFRGHSVISELHSEKNSELHSEKISKLYLEKISKLHLLRSFRTTFRQKFCIKNLSFSDIIGKRWPHVSKKDVTRKLAEALKPNLFKEL